MTESPPTPQTILFARGVIARLAIWPTLRIAVQESWGGPDAKHKPTWIASTIVDSFQDAADAKEELPDEQYIEEMLVQIMEDEFEAVLEDDSTTSVAKDIVRMWVETRDGKEDTVKKFEELSEKVKGKRVEIKISSTSDDEEGWEDEQDENEEFADGDDVPQLMEHRPPLSRTNDTEVDEDGFTLVKGKGKGQR